MSRSGGTASRRDVLKTAAALGAAGAASSLSGCTGILSGGSHLEHVPRSVQNVTYVDPNTVLEDDATKRLANTYLGKMSEREYYSGPEDYEEARDDMEDEIDMSLEDLEYAVNFAEYSDYGMSGEYSGTIVYAEWNERDVVSSLEDDYEATYEEEEYEGQPLHTPDSEWAPHLGVAEEGVFVQGSERAVKDVIDIAAGERDALEGDLSDGYSATRDGPIRWVGEMPPWMNESLRGPEGQEFSLEAFKDTDWVNMSVYKSGDERGAETTFRAVDEDTAKDIEDVISGYIDVVKGSGELDSEMESVLDASTVERDGTDVTVRYQATVGELQSLLESTLES